MKDCEKRFVNRYSPAMEDEEEEESLYCMISPTEEDARKERDDQTVCSNRS